MHSIFSTEQQEHRKTQMSEAKNRVLLASDIEM